MHLIFDGSFEGFLSLIYDAYTKKLLVESIDTCKSSTLLSQNHEIFTCEEKSTKVYNAIKRDFPKEHIDTIHISFLCEDKELYMHLFYFIKMGFKDVKSLDNINLDFVFILIQKKKEFFRLVHRMYGFIRFEELDDETLYATFEAKFNLISYIARHFIKRLRGCSFILHDRTRALAYVYDGNSGTVHQVDHFDMPKFSKDEAKFKALWKTFFQSVSVQSRKNLKAQQNFVPLLYRKYMSEFDS